MKFSVIIPCYNAASTIERALDSLTLQAFDDWEVICIDDCSKDNTAEVIKSYSDKHKDSRITLLRNEKNSGPGVSRNNGIEKAKGDYLMFLDADDYYDLTTFDVLNTEISQSDADIVFFGSNQIIGSTKRKRPIKARNSISEYMALVGGSLCMAVWKLSLWKGIELPHISNAEDIAVIPILISRARCVMLVENTLYNYVHGNNSTSSRHDSQVSYNFVASYHYTLQHIDKEKFRDAVEFHGIKTIIYGATLNALKAGMPKEEILQLWSEFETIFPNWINNKYVNSYSRVKRAFVRMASRRRFVLMRAYAYLHNLILKQIG